MCYSHIENNTGEERLEEERRNPTSHPDIRATQKQEGAQAQFGKLKASQWKRRMQSSREFVTQRPWTPSWESN